MNLRAVDSLGKRFVLAWAGAFVLTLLAWSAMSWGTGSVQNLAAWVMTACLVAVAAVPFAAIAAWLVTGSRGLMVLLAAALTIVAIGLWFFGIPQSATQVV